MFVQVFLSIGQVRTNARFELRQEVGSAEAASFVVFTLRQEMSLERYKWLVKREAVGDTVFSTFGKYLSCSQTYLQFIPSFLGGSKQMSKKL